MPFEIAPRVGAFQGVADSILRGCALPATTDGGAYRQSAGVLTHVCVWAAHLVGRGARTSHEISNMGDEDWIEMDSDYERHYGQSAVIDFVSGKFTREQIAARIAAL